MVTYARSRRKSRINEIAGDSRVSPVSALNAKPNTAMCYKKRMNRKTGIRNNTDTYNNEMNLTRSSCKYEGKTNLAGNSVEQGVNNGLGESALLVLIHLDHLSPVGGNLRQV